MAQPGGVPGAAGVPPMAYYAHPAAAAPPVAAAPAAAYQPPPPAGAPAAYAPVLPPGMPAASPSAGAKRPYEAAGTSAGSGYAAAAGAKRQHVGSAAAAPAAAATAGLSPTSVPRESVYRLVMDVVDTALIIGRGGQTVRQIELATGGRVKRLQEPPGGREQVVVIWSSHRELPSPGRATRNPAQEALIDCVRRVVFQENAPMGQPARVRLLINRTQEYGVMENMSAVVADNPGTTMAFRRGQDLPLCALDNDVMVELTGERYALMAAVEMLSHILREHPILERPGGAPPALRAMVTISPAAAAPPAAPGGAYPAAAGAYGAAYRPY